MATSDGLVGLPSGEATKELTLQWRRLIRTATAVAVLTSPVVYFFFREEAGTSRGWSLFWTFLAIIAFRGLMDIIMRRFIPWPSLFGTDDPAAREEDVVNRRRAWYWRKWFRLATWVVGIITFFWLIKLAIPGGETSWISTITEPWEALSPILSDPSLLRRRADEDEEENDSLQSLLRKAFRSRARLASSSLGMTATPGLVAVREPLPPGLPVSLEIVLDVSWPAVEAAAEPAGIAAEAGDDQPAQPQDEHEELQHG